MYLIYVSVIFQIHFWDINPVNEAPVLPGQPMFDYVTF